MCWVYTPKAGAATWVFCGVGPVQPTTWAQPLMLVLGENIGQALEVAHEVIGNVLHAEAGLHVIVVSWRPHVCHDRLAWRMHADASATPVRDGGMALHGPCPDTGRVRR
jgi:hypothetical protein